MCLRPGIISELLWNRSVCIIFKQIFFLFFTELSGKYYFYCTKILKREKDGYLRRRCEPWDNLLKLLSIPLISHVIEKLCGYYFMLYTYRASPLLVYFRRRHFSKFSRHSSCYIFGKLCDHLFILQLPFLYPHFVPPGGYV